MKKLLYIIFIIGIALYFNKKNNSSMYEYDSASYQQKYISEEAILSSQKKGL